MNNGAYNEVYNHVDEIETVLDKKGMKFFYSDGQFFLDDGFYIMTFEDSDESGQDIEILDTRTDKVLHCFDTFDKFKRWMNRWY